MTSARVTAGFGALFGLLVLIFLISVHGASRLAGLDADIGRARDMLAEIELARSTLREVETARRGYLLTRADEFLELFLTLTKESVGRLARLHDLTADDPLQRRRVDALGPLVARQLALVTDTIASPPASARDLAAAHPLAADGAVVTQEILGLVGELWDAETGRLREREVETKRLTVRVIRGFAGVALVALLLVGAAYYTLERDAAVHAAVVEELRLYTGPLAAGEPTAESDVPDAHARST